MEGNKLDFAELAKITFEKPDVETFRGLKLGYDAGRIGGSMPTVYNAANEYAVGQFLRGEIKYLDIARTIETCMECHHVVKCPSMNDILQIEADTRARIAAGLW